MAKKDTEKEYISVAKTTSIHAESKVTIKIRDNFYSVTYAEDRDIPDIEGVDVEKERIALFDDVNKIVDDQAEDIITTFQKR